MAANSVRVVLCFKSVKVGGGMAELALSDVRLRVDEQRNPQRCDAHRPPRDGGRAGRAGGQRQDHAVAHRRRPRSSRMRARSASAARTVFDQPTRRRAAAKARHRIACSESDSLLPQRTVFENVCVLRPLRRIRRRGHRCAPTRRSNGSAPSTSPTGIRRSLTATTAGAWRSRARCCASRRCCCSTIRSSHLRRHRAR